MAEHVIAYCPYCGKEIYTHKQIYCLQTRYMRSGNSRHVDCGALLEMLPVDLTKEWEAFWTRTR